MCSALLATTVPKVSAPRRIVAWVRRHPLAADAALAAALLVVVEQDTLTNGWVRGPIALYAVAGLAMTAPLALRRRRSLLMPAIVFGALIVQDIAAGSDARTPDPQLAAWIVAAYSVAAYCDRRGALAGAALALGATVGWIGIDDFLLPVTVIGAALIAGRLVHGGQLRTSELELRTVALDRERDALAQAAVVEERARIARELHDVVAHSISVMGVQAGAVRRLLEPEQEEQREALLSVERTGREALAEMRRLLGILRRSDDELAHAPPPTMAGVAELIGQLRDAGLPVDLRVEGEPVPLGPGVDISAYRIVQEALTNTLKHAGPARASVVVRYLPRALEIEVIDDGRGAAHNGGGGHGLVGMRERVALYGGELRAGSEHGRGYAVRARLPLEPESG
jgi:signal transduction histidine kinase